MTNDEAAVLFETANNGEGPEIVAEIDRETFETIVAARRAKAEADRALEAAVARARSKGQTWEIIGAALGVSRQAAHAKYVHAMR